MVGDSVARDHQRVGRLLVSRTLRRITHAFTRARRKLRNGLGIFDRVGREAFNGTGDRAGREREGWIRLRLGRRHVEWREENRQNWRGSAALDETVLGCLSMRLSLIHI